MSISTTMLINSLKTHQNLWTITVTVLRQGRVELYKNGEGKIRKIIVVDNAVCTNANTYIIKLYLINN